MHILLTGAAGFIGSHVADRLIALGHSVVGIDTFSDYYSPTIKEENIAAALTSDRFTLKRIDITDATTLKTLFESEAFAQVIHLAAQPGVRASIDHPERTQKANIEGTYTLFEAARIAGVSHIVFASSSSVYGATQHIPFVETEPLNTPLSPYAASKQACELIAYTYHALYNMHMIGLRFFTVYGERGRPDMSPFLFMDALMNDRELTQFGDGMQERDFTYISDIVDGIVACIGMPLGYEIINLGNNRPIALREYIALLEKITGKKARLQVLPEQPGEMKRTCADIHKAQQLLGFAPRIGLEEGLQNMLEWYKQRR